MKPKITHKKVKRFLHLCSLKSLGSVTHNRLEMNMEAVPEFHKEVVSHELLIIATLKKKNGMSHMTRKIYLIFWKISKMKVTDCELNPKDARTCSNQENVTFSWKTFPKTMEQQSWQKNESCFVEKQKKTVKKNRTMEKKRRKCWR